MSLFTVIWVPGAILGSEAKMRLNINVFVTSKVYREYAETESFGWISGECMTSDCLLFFQLR